MVWRTFADRRTRPGLVGSLFILYALASLCGEVRAAQPAPVDVSIAQQAVGVVTKHYSLNPFALDPKTGKSLPPNGGWSIGTTPPPACAQASAKCVEVFYQVPAQSVRCSWTVLVNADGSDGTILDENDDAEHYLLRKVSRDEAKAQVTARKLPVFPPIAVAAHVSGDVIVTVIIGKSGEVDKIASVTGQPMEQRAAIDAAQQWTFAPLIVGTRAIPYSIQLTFMFRGNGLSNSKVYATP